MKFTATIIIWLAIFQFRETSPLYTMVKLEQNPGLVFEHINNAGFYTKILKIFTTFDINKYEQLRQNLSHYYRETIRNMTYMGIDFLPDLHEILNLNTRPPTDTEQNFLQKPTTKITQTKLDYNIYITNQIQDIINDFHDYINGLTDAPKLYHDVARR